MPGYRRGPAPAVRAAGETVVIIACAAGDKRSTGSGRVPADARCGSLASPRAESPESGGLRSSAQLTVDPPYIGRCSGALKVLIDSLKTLYQYLVLYGALAVFGVGGLIYTAVSPLCGFLLPTAAGNRLGQVVMMGLFRFFVGLLRLSRIVHCDLDDLDRLRGESLLLVPNHPSLLDAVLIVSRLPNVVCIMKAQILDNPFLGGGARLAGYIRGDHPMEMMRKARQALHSGRHVLVFPEGTRTDTPPVNPFKGNFALMAKQAKKPVQTVFLHSDSPYLQRGWPLFRKPEFPIHYRAALGQRFEPHEDPQELKRKVEAYFREVLAPGRIEPDR